LSSTYGTRQPARDCYDKINTTVAVIGLVALIGYTIFAGYQSDQLKKATVATKTAANAAGDAARAAEKSNRIAIDNARTDLRAYVSVGGGPNHSLAEIIEDPATKRAVVPIYFFNGGRTPAYNFIATFATGGLKQSTGHLSEPNISRFDVVSGAFKGARMGGGGINIPAGSVHIEYLADKNALTWSDLKDINRGQSFSIYGEYAYCDEFGEYRCRRLALSYDNKSATFVPGPFMDMDCFTSPVVPPKEPGAMLVLKRCEQPDERKKEAEAADANAGKVFPAATPVPSPTKK
jgi:hypothetical protein